MIQAKHSEGQGAFQLPLTGAEGLTFIDRNVIRAHAGVHVHNACFAR